MVTDFHLILDQVFSLCKISDELLPFLAFQVAYPSFMNHICYFQLFLLELQLLLFVKKFLAKYFFFLVQIDEYF